MKLTSHFPCPLLSQFVDRIWAVKGVARHAREKVLPNGAIELIINLGSYHKVVDKTDFRHFNVYRESWIAGMQTDHIIIEALRESDLIGIRFRPGGAYPFLKFPVSAITDQILECDLLSVAGMDELRERLFTAVDSAERFRLVENFLLKRLDPKIADPLVGYAVGEIHKNDGHISVRELSREVGLSNKQFINRFRKTVGIPPKLFGRILRFQSVISRVSNQPTVCWTEVAQQCNYYDQAHLIREFHIFSGSNPSSYLKHRDEDENHIVVD